MEPFVKSREQMKAELEEDMRDMTPEQRVAYLQILAQVTGITDFDIYLFNLYRGNDEQKGGEAG